MRLYLCNIPWKVIDPVSWLSEGSVPSTWWQVSCITQHGIANLLCCVLPVDVFFRANDQRLIYDLQVPKNFAFIIIKGNDCIILFFLYLGDVVFRVVYSLEVVIDSRGSRIKIPPFSLFVFKACNFGYELELIQGNVL